MKKLFAIFLGIVLLAAAGYAASAYYIGRQVEVSLAEPYKKLAYDPNVKLVKREYQRGLFVSTETVVIEILGDIFRALGQPPLTLTAYSVINHGPAPRFSTMAAATVDSTLHFGAAGKPGQKMMTAHTVIRHDGSGDTTAIGVASVFDFTDPMGASRRVSWEAFKGAMQFSDGMRDYSMQGQMPRFEVSGEDGMRLSVSGIKFESVAKQMFDDEPSLHAVTQKVSIDEVSAKGRFGAGPPVMVRNISYDATSPVKGEFIDGVVKSTAGELLVAQQNYGPAHFDMAVKHMHGRSMIKLQKAMAGINRTGQAASDPMAAIQPLLASAIEVLAHEPELVIDRLSFTTPDGEFLIKANARFTGVTPDDASNMMALTQKLEASTDITVPEALLAQFGATPVSIDAASAQAQKRDQHIARLVEQGYVIREGVMLKSKITYQGGQLTINGLPFDPMSAMQPPQPVGQPIPIPPARLRAPMPVAR